MRTAVLQTAGKVVIAVPSQVNGCAITFGRSRVALSAAARSVDVGADISASSDRTTRTVEKDACDNGDRWASDTRARNASASWSPPDVPTGR